MMNDNQSPTPNQSRFDTLTILGVQVPTETRMLQQRSLKFFADNPRVYSVVRANGRQPSQEEIQERLCEMEHVKELREDIKRNGGLIEPLIVRQGTFEVLEGNSRLAAYRQLASKEPIKWGVVKCTLLPEDIDDSLVFALLGQVHIKGKKDWAPYEQAGFLHRRCKNHNIAPKTLAEEVGLSVKKVNHLIDTYEFMVNNDEEDINRWSYYDEYLKSNKIKRARAKLPQMDEIVIASIKSGSIERAMDLRDQLPAVCASAPILRRYAEGKITLDEAYARAIDSGADSVPYKKVSAFRRWITETEIEATVAASPQRIRDKLLYELDKVAVRIAAIRKKYS
jgi:hypothetical protein